MPDKWDKYADKSDKWDKYAEDTGGRSGFFAAEHPVLAEIGSQVKRAGQGVVQTFKDVAGAAAHNPDAAGRLMRTVKEGFKGPARELAGLPQPGETATTDVGILDRPIRAVEQFLGGDAPRARALLKEGKTGESAAAALTIPVLTLGLGKFLRIPKETPPPGFRTAKLTAATGTASEGGVKIDFPKTWEQVLPRLDATVEKTGGLPAKSKITPRWLKEVVDNTFALTENEYQQALSPLSSVRMVPQKVADRIRSKITQGMIEHEPEMATALENEAKKWEQPHSVEAMEDMRKILWRQKKQPLAERLAQRSNVGVIADDAAESSLRDVLYDLADKSANKKGGYFRKLKQDQAALYEINDRLTKELADLSNRDAVRKGTPFLEKESVSTYAHPSGSVGMSFHKIHGLVGGGPGKSAARKTAAAFQKQPSIGRTSRVGIEGAAGSSSRQPPNEAPPPGASNVFPRVHLKEYAAQNGINEQQAEQALRSMGFEVR